MPRSRWSAAIAALLLSAAVAPAVQAAAPQRWSVRIMGNDAGFMTVAREPGDVLRAHFEFNDRGRGPKIDSRIALAPDGTLLAVENDGNEYYKGAVAERFDARGEKATWNNRAEKGEGAAHGFYASFDGAPIENGLLAAAAARAPGQRLALLPSGEVKVRRVGDVEVRAGGKKHRVVQWELLGLGFQPSTVWLDPDNGYFGEVSDWFTMLPVGWEAAAPTLLEVQRKADEARQGELARTLAHRPPPAGIAFTGAGLFDPESRVVRPGMTVLVVGEWIAAVGTDGTIAIPPGAEVVDARGETIIPGLWDMHQHLGDLDGILDIAAGVTTGRDLANDTDSLLARRKRWDTGEAIGPRIELAGFIDGPGPYAGPTKVLVDTPEEALAAVDRYAELGYKQIKMYSSLDPALVPVIARRAHEKGMRVSGHVPATMIAEQAIAAGYDEIQHVNFLFLDLWPEVTETRTPARFVEVGERAADVDLAGPAMRKLIDLMRQKDIVSDPTLATFEELYSQHAGEIGPGYRDVADRLPAQVRRGLLSGGLPMAEGKDVRYAASFAKAVQLVGALHAAGVRIVAGTDALAGFQLHRELELYVQAGIPAPQGAAHRHPRRGAGDAPRGRARLARSRQARRPRPGPRRPEPRHPRPAEDRDGGQGWNRLRQRGALRGRRRRTARTLTADAGARAPGVPTPR